MAVAIALAFFLENLVVAVSLVLTFIVLLQGQRRLINWLFSLFMLTLTLWSGGSFMLHFVGTDPKGEALWLGVALLGLLTMPQALYLLALALSDVPPGSFRLVSVTLGFAGMACAWLGVFAEGYMTHIVIERSFALTYLPNTKSFFYWSALLYSFIQVLLSLGVIGWSVVRTHRATGQIPREKLLLGFGGSMVFLGGVFNVFPTLGSQPLDSLLMIGAGFVFAYLILKEQFFDPWREDRHQLSTANVRLREQARQLQNANRRLREADRHKNEFVARMSHEFRTPLNSIIGFARVILNGIDGPITDDQHTDLTAIYTSGQHLLGLVNDILDLSKIAAGKMTLKCEWVSFKELTLGVMPSIIPLVEGKPIELYEEIADDLPPIYVARLRIRQVVLNLLSNAAKFTDRGTITLRAELQTHNDDHVSCPAPYLLCSIADTGIGIDEKDFPLVFEEFRQIDSSMARRAEGSGLGLPISKKFVELHGGCMWLESKVGRGSTFYFALPVESVSEQ